MARVLIVGCGCRGRELGRALRAEGHAVRGTTRDAPELPRIESTGIEAVEGDPDRLMTLLPHLEGVSAVVWLMGSARGAPDAVAALHGPRLESLLEALVDTHARGLVYEASGDVEGRLLARGREVVRAAAGRHRMPCEVVAEDPRRVDRWLTEMTAAVARLLSG